MQDPFIVGLVFVTLTLLGLGFGVWLGKTRISPRIQRRLDRADSDEEPSDRHD